MKPAGFRNSGSWSYEGAGASAIPEAPRPCAADRIRLGRRKGQQMMFVAARRARTAVRAEHAEPGAMRVLTRGRSGALALGIAAAAAVAVPASASASTDASPVAGHVYV